MCVQFIYVEMITKSIGYYFVPLVFSAGSYMLDK